MNGQTAVIGNIVHAAMDVVNPHMFDSNHNLMQQQQQRCGNQMNCMPSNCNNNNKTLADSMASPAGGKAIRPKRDFRFQVIQVRQGPKWFIWPSLNNNRNSMVETTKNEHNEKSSNQENKMQNNDSKQMDPPLTPDSLPNTPSEPMPYMTLADIGNRENNVRLMADSQPNLSSDELSKTPTVFYQLPNMAPLSEPTTRRFLPSNLPLNDAFRTSSNSPTTNSTSDTPYHTPYSPPVTPFGEGQNFICVPCPLNYAVLCCQSSTSTTGTCCSTSSSNKSCTQDEPGMQFSSSQSSGISTGTAQSCDSTTFEILAVSKKEDYDEDEDEDETILDENQDNICCSNCKMD